MRIILLDVKPGMCEAWKKYFKDEENVEIVNSDIEDYDIENIQCLVSPANSYGLMDGGYDLGLTKVFGNELQKRVQDYIYKNCYGEQLVGSSIIVDIPNTNKKLIHTPTMRIPLIIDDTDIVYLAMRSTLICALNNNIESIVIPAFGSSTGKVPNVTLAYQMYRAYVQIFKTDVPVHSWDDVDVLDEAIYKYIKGKR